MKLSADWRTEIQDMWGIQILESIECAPQGALWTTRCSKTKSDVARGRPKDFYVSPVNKFFYRWAEEQGVRYGVLSDKYGLHLDDEELEHYDLHPSVLTVSDKQRLGRLIQQKASEAGFDSVVFYSPSPLMSVPYFEMLCYSGLEIFYTTRLGFSAKCLD